MQIQAEERKKEVEELKSSLQEARAECKERCKEVEELKAALDARSRALEEVKGELKEVEQLVEEKTKEVDDTMNKYCSLMLEVHKLEVANETLTTRLEYWIASKPANKENLSHSGTTGGRRRSTRSSTKNLDVQTENSAPSTPQKSPLGSSPGKRGHKHMSNKDSAQEALHNLTKKIRANAVTTPKQSTEQEDEFRPEGLPELVQRGMTALRLSHYALEHL